MQDQILLEMKGISKSFPGVCALENVDFQIAVGEVHALMGENGAGKSTLIKILTGIYQRQRGEILLQGRPVEPDTPLKAQHLGIRTIYQEINLIPSLSIAENIFLGREPRRLGLIDWPRMYQQASDLLLKMNLQVDVRDLLKTHSTAVQQMVAIARALSVEAKLVVMDEPTSSLDEGEVNILFDVIRKLKQAGIAVLFITHRIDEVFRICDRVTILKDGKKVGDYPTGSISRIELISKMIGKEASEIVQEMKFRREGKEEVRREEELYEGIDLHRGFKVRGVSLQIRKGEIVGIAGLLGAGRTELAKVLFGADQPERGILRLKGRPIRLGSPRDAIRKNIAFCSEDRRAEGIIPRMTVRDNMSLAALPRLCSWGVVSRKKQQEMVDAYIRKLRIKVTDGGQRIRNLSGGNQQKVILARWLCLGPELIILDEPTRGIDVGAKMEVEGLIREMTGTGISVLLISSELELLVRNCDRVIVMRDGQVVQELAGSLITEEHIMQAIAHEGVK